MAFDLMHRDQVILTERSRRLKVAGFFTVAKRWYAALSSKAITCTDPLVHLSSASHIVVALEIPLADEKLLQSMREFARRAVSADAHCRITCVTVLTPSILDEEDQSRDLANNLYTQALLEMRHWAQLLQLSPEKIRFHVLEANDPADALLQFSRTNHVDQIIMGARGSSALRRILGSVSAKVAAAAPCNVTVVRVPRAQVI